VHSGKYDLAEETIERALRIEPDNPTLWVELGEVWMTEGDAAQADATSRRALSLAAGDRQVQATAWRLIVESLRARGRNQEAVDADREAIALAAQ
jgi:predicted Zn-dependent protease